MNPDWPPAHRDGLCISTACFTSPCALVHRLIIALALNYYEDALSVPGGFSVTDLGHGSGISRMVQYLCRVTGKETITLIQARRHQGLLFFQVRTVCQSLFGLERSNYLGRDEEANKSWRKEAVESDSVLRILPQG
jgi:hypothetical protein